MKRTQRSLIMISFCLNKKDGTDAESNCYMVSNRSPERLRQNQNWKMTLKRHLFFAIIILRFINNLGERKCLLKGNVH